MSTCQVVEAFQQKTDLKNPRLFDNTLYGYCASELDVSQKGQQQIQGGEPNFDALNRRMKNLDSKQNFKINIIDLHTIFL